MKETKMPELSPSSTKVSADEAIKRDIIQNQKSIIVGAATSNSDAAALEAGRKQQLDDIANPNDHSSWSGDSSDGGIVDSIEPMPTETPITERQTSSSTPGAFHTNATSTRTRAAGKTPRSVLGAELRLANKPGQDFATTTRQRQEPDPSVRPDPQSRAQEEAEAGVVDEDPGDQALLNNLTVANPVVEEFLKDLQLAEEIDPEVASRRSWRSAASSNGRHSKDGSSAIFGMEDTNSNNSNKSTSASVYCKAALLVFLVGGITLLLVFTLAPNNKDDTDTTPKTEKDTHLSVPTQLPTQSPTSLDSYVLNLLPPSTVQTIQKDIHSPQATAYEWLLQDPNLPTYSQERILQRFVLSTLFYSTEGYNWRDNTQWLSYYSHECEWYTRPTFAMKETIQYIYDGYLTEFVDEELEKCNQEDGGILQHLWLDSNHLVGTIPPELYLLTSLQSLSMGLNPGLTGTIGTQIGLLTELQGLALYYNPHGGTVPSQIGLLTKLKSLGINDNGHTGAIPTEIYNNLTNLQTITLARNSFRGTIPTSIANLSKLRWFVTDITELTGSLPSQMGQLSRLEWLVVGGNQLTGSLPSQLGLMSSNLLMLSLFENQFTGTMPTQLGQLTSTTLLSFRANQFDGTIPTQYGLLTDLTLALNFQDNPQLTGTIPSELGGLTNVWELALVNNNHTGPIPSELGLLTQLRRLTFGNNSLSGSIPTQLSNVASTLYTLSIQGNLLLSGTVPVALCNINATCIAGSLNPCEGMLGLKMDCTDLLCGCGGECPCHNNDNEDIMIINEEEEEANENITTKTTTLVVIPPQD